MSASDEDLAQLLRNANPAPRPGFVEELERSLALPRRAFERRPWLLIAGAGVACAAVVVCVTRRR